MLMRGVPWLKNVSLTCVSFWAHSSIVIVAQWCSVLFSFAQGQHIVWILATLESRGRQKTWGIMSFPFRLFFAQLIHTIKEQRKRRNLSQCLTSIYLCVAEPSLRPETLSLKSFCCPTGQIGLRGFSIFTLAEICSFVFGVAKATMFKTPGPHVHLSTSRLQTRTSQSKNLILAKEASSSRELQMEINMALIISLVTSVAPH